MAATPSPDARGHRSVLAGPAVDLLLTDPAGTYVDATFGRGGHSRLLLDRLSPTGRLLALDRDPAAVAAASGIGDARFHIEHTAFSRLEAMLDACGVSQVHGVLLDLGVSSPQIDEAARGFSWRGDGPLDMRMDTTAGQTAAEWLAKAGPDELTRVIRDYGDRKSRADGAQHPATRTFQAVRIHVNQELEELALALEQAGRRLRAGGRLVVISFHSLEDRIVKRFIDAHAHPDRPGARERALPLRAAELPAPRLTTLARVRADAAEVALNPRARSAVLRAAERTAAPWPHIP
ncbi:MAG: 16S rRNA (cytosine(1402)-N(4))-methyltransferase RsmH [Burkholderiaceae bacterium]|nr:16S rRNA (cytosine(1402)-N(4))-methyltransferase RsmH [Burkholderiaceae bacterium]